VAIVAAIALTLRRRKQTRYQDPAEQLAATKAQRLRIVRDEVGGAASGDGGGGR
jgi:NADH-quinone oxidoreductase subunit J